VFESPWAHLPKSRSHLARRRRSRRPSSAPATSARRYRALASQRCVPPRSGWRGYGACRAWSSWRGGFIICTEERELRLRSRRPSNARGGLRTALSYGVGSGRTTMQPLHTSTPAFTRQCRGAHTICGSGGTSHFNCGMQVNCTCRQACSAASWMSASDGHLAARAGSAPARSRRAAYPQILCTALSSLPPRLLPVVAAEGPRPTYVRTEGRPP
jgi:hypothetical protein